MVRTHLDARDAKDEEGNHCGDGMAGVSSLCVAEHFSRTDGNPARQFKEDEVLEQLKNEGPVSVALTIRRDFMEHLRARKQSPYLPNPTSPIIGTHSAVIIGYGQTKTGMYWKLHDSNKGEDGHFLEYRIFQNSGALHSFIGQVINNEILIPKGHKVQLAFGEETHRQTLGPSGFILGWLHRLNHTQYQVSPPNPPCMAPQGGEKRCSVQ